MQRNHFTGECIFNDTIMRNTSRGSHKNIIQNSIQFTTSLEPLELLATTNFSKLFVMAGRAIKKVEKEND